MKAEDKSLVIDSLLRQDYYILSLEEEKLSSREINLELNFRPVRTRDMIIATRQLATMIAAGLPLLNALIILGDQSDNPRLKQAIYKIRDDIEQGMTMWAAVARHPRIFSPIYINMLRAGETGGILEPVLEKLADYLEKEQEINSRIKAASIYPTIITIFAILMVFFITVFVMPTFVTMYQSSGAELPGPTRVLLAISFFIRQRWVFLILGTIMLIIAFKLWSKTRQGRLVIDYLYLHLPVIGKTLSRLIVARFSRTLGTLLRSGIPVLQAMEIVEGTVGNKVIADAIKGARANISKGESITVPLKATGVFEPMVTNMIAVGEESGSLDEMLIRMADYFEKEVMYMVDSMMAVIEPVMIFMVALLVGGIVIATLLPVFDLVNAVGF
ncbi:MAG: type II secretion system F family protein [Syntrophomonadaceae bacterium]|nr:type II secretion system F family protein [Syntrophomonadaceae bacterium]